MTPVVGNGHQLWHPLLVTPASYQLALVPSPLLEKRMRSSVARSNASGYASRWVRGTACHVAMPMQPRSLHGAARGCHLRLFLTRVTGDPNRLPDPALNDIALERYNKAYDQLNEVERAWCITKNASDARLQGRQPRPKAEDDDEMQRIAQETYGKPYQELDTRQKQVCAGKKGNNARLKAAAESGRREKTEDAVLQAIAQEKFGRDLVDLTEDENRVCINTKASRTRWAGHEAKLKPEDNQDLQSWAQKLYGKPYQLLSTAEKRSCAGKAGATQRYGSPGSPIDYSVLPLQEAQELLAQEKYGKPYAELTHLQKKSVSNIKSRRIAEMRERSGQKPTTS